MALAAFFGGCLLLLYGIPGIYIGLECAQVRGPPQCTFMFPYRPLSTTGAVALTGGMGFPPRFFA